MAKASEEIFYCYFNITVYDNFAYMKKSLRT